MSSKPTIQFKEAGGFISGVCGATSLVDKEGYMVKKHTDGTWILCSSQGEYGFVLVHGAAVGGHISVAPVGAEGFGKTNSAITTYLDELTTGTDGMFEAAASGDYVSAMNLDVGTASGDYLRIVTVGYFKP
jgi:hypothetical protein